MERIILSSHEQHIKILKRIRSSARFVEIVIPYGEAPNDALIISLKPFLLETKKVWEWTGTISRGTASTLYRYSSDDALFQYLNEYDSFFINVPLRNSPDDFIYINDDILRWQMEYTSFGNKDIAFLDENNDVLFYTTTHEGDAFINEKFEFVVEGIGNS